jgi:hypothetical protein
VRTAAAISSPGETIHYQLSNTTMSSVTDITFLPISPSNADDNNIKLSSILTTLFVGVEELDTATDVCNKLTKKQTANF